MSSCQNNKNNNYTQSSGGTADKYYHEAGDFLRKYRWWIVLLLVALLLYYLYVNRKDTSVQYLDIAPSQGVVVPRAVGPNELYVQTGGYEPVNALRTGLNLPI
jgi:preprotein translocase subunit SecG